LGLGRLVILATRRFQSRQALDSFVFRSRARYAAFRSVSDCCKKREFVTAAREPSASARVAYVSTPQSKARMVFPAWRSGVQTMVTEAYHFPCRWVMSQVLGVPRAIFSCIYRVIRIASDA
jgi:hypothetical protein